MAEAITYGQQFLPVVASVPGADAADPPGWAGDLGAAGRRYVEVRTAGHRFRGDTGATVRSTLNGLVRSTGPVAPADLRRHHIEAWVASIGHPQTAANRLSQVRSFCRWLVLEGVLASDPTVEVPRPRQPRAVPRALAADPVSRLLAVCPDNRARFVVTAMVQLGLRCAEVTGMRFEDIGDGQVRIRGKGGHQRMLPWLPEVGDALDAYLADHPAGAGPVVRAYAPASGKGRTVHVAREGKGVSAEYLSELVARWMAHAGLKDRIRDGVSAHALRHTMATDALRGGAHLRDVQRALGHVSLATTERYLGLEVEGLEKAMGGRRYGPAGPASATPATDLAPPELDAVGPLIDAVAAIAAAVERIEARLAVGEAAAGLPKGNRLAAAGLWPGTVGHQRSKDDSGIESSVESRSDYGQELLPVGKSSTRPAGRPTDGGCPWGDPHSHTAAGHCICPLCRQSSAGIVWGEVTMASHFARPHTRCPDCDRSFIDLDRHRRKAHPWAAPV